MFVNRLSKLFIDEKVNSETSSDENLIVVDKDNLEYVDRMFLSKSSVDKRFLRLYRIVNQEADLETDRDLVQPRRLSLKNNPKKKQGKVKPATIPSFAESENEEEDSENASDPSSQQ